MAAITTFAQVAGYEFRVRSGQAGLMVGDQRVDWLEVWRGCERRLMTWRVPPRWSSQDWREEIRAEGAAAAVAAARDFNPDLRVPLEAYLRMRMLGQVLVRYRKEWTYAMRQFSCSSESLGIPPLASDFAELMREDLSDALEHLNERDRSLIERIFWSNETEAEIGRTLGLSQQAVNKRKQSIIRSLREMIETSRI